MLKKKAQISIFIIIGIVIIIVTSFLIYNNKFDFFISHDTKMKNQVSDVVKNCISTDANKGAFLLGFQGGYITIPKMVELNPKKYINLGFKIPNWDSQSDNIPTINSMQEQLNNYIENNSPSCIENNLRALNNTFDIYYNSTLKVKTQINKENINVEANLPIRFNEKNSKQILSVSDYFVKLDSLRLGDMYNLAVQIYNLEAEKYFLEDLTLDQIYSANDYSSPQSMPSEGMSFTCAKRIWTIPQLKQNLIVLNNNNFKYLYIKGTYPITQTYDSNLNKNLGTENLRAYFEKNYEFKLNNPKSSYKNYKAEFFVPTPQDLRRATYGPLDPFKTFKVTPSSGNIVKPMDFKIDVGAKIPVPCIQVYHHLYTLDYNVMVKLTDDSADGGHFMFQFPLRVKIDKNNPKVQAPSIITGEASTVDNSKYCANESKKYPLDIYVKDNNDNYLSGVNISYQCISLSCDMGQTKKTVITIRGKNYESKYSIPKLSVKYPFCIGGKIIAKKDGYQKAEIRVDTDESLLKKDTTPYYDIKMIPLKKFKVTEGTFLLKFIEDGKGMRLYDNSEGYIYLTIENKNKKFESDAVWPTQKGFLDTINLLDEENTVYNVSAIYVDKNYNLKGILEIKNWKPDIHAGNNIEFVIPASRKIIDENSYLGFYNYMQQALTNPSSDYGIRIN